MSVLNVFGAVFCLFMLLESDEPWWRAFYAGFFAANVYFIIAAPS